MLPCTLPLASLVCTSTSHVTSLYCLGYNVSRNCAVEEGRLRQFQHGEISLIELAQMKLLYYCSYPRSDFVAYQEWLGGWRNYMMSVSHYRS